VTAPAVVLRGVGKRLGGRAALDGVSLTAGGGVTALLGPNGSGKTTLLRLLATVLAPDRGEIRLLGLDPGDEAQRLRIRRSLGYLPQAAGLHPTLTAFAFVDYVAILKEWRERPARHREVRRVLHLVGLEEASGARLGTLSVGFRRRVGLAQALLGDPALLVLDEPAAGLDPEQRLDLLDLLARLGADRTVVLSTHDPSGTAVICDQVVVLEAGGVRFAGPPAALGDASIEAGYLQLLERG